MMMLLDGEEQSSMSFRCTITEKGAERSAPEVLRQAAVLFHLAAELRATLH